jgi:hypothetical protein
MFMFIVDGQAGTIVRLRKRLRNRKGKRDEESERKQIHLVKWL